MDMLILRSDLSSMREENRRDQSRYIYNSVHTAVTRLETGYIIINNAFIIRRSDVLRDATIQYIYPFYIYIYLYIFIFFFAIHLYICSYIFIFIYLYAFIFILFIYIYIY